jgi:hypothetical protein
VKYTKKLIASRTDPLPRLTPRDLRWLTFLNRHGALPSGYLYANTQDTHRCKDTALRRLLWLSQQGILFRPPQQQTALNAPFNPYIYDLTNLGYEVLYEAGVKPNQARPTGHFPHLFLTACVTSSIEMNAAKAGSEYIEASTILQLKNSQLAIPLGSAKLIPDQLFALKSEDGYRVFALELDRGTEPIVSTQIRKSYQRSTEQYRQVIERKIHQSHYGLSGHLLVLWVFTSRRREEAFRELLGKQGGALQRQCLTQSIAATPGGWRPPSKTLQFSGMLDAVISSGE